MYANARTTELAADLARNVDLMIVIGGKNSGNTNRLARFVDVDVQHITLKLLPLQTGMVSIRSTDGRSYSRSIDSQTGLL